jgi:hypothetical protein
MVRGFKVLAFAVALIALALPSTGQAAKKKQKVKPVVTVTATQTSTASNQLITARADCPKGRTAVGGGFGAPTGGTPTTDFHIVYESRLSNASEPQGWTAKGVRADGGSAGNPLTMTAYARCAGKLRFKGKARKLVLLTRSATTPSADTAQQTSASAVCPKSQVGPGYSAIGGGFAFVGDPVVVGTASFPTVWQSAATSANTWSLGMSVSGTQPRAMIDSAYCAPRKAPAVRAGTAVLPTSSGVNLSFATATTLACPKKRQPVGGGFSHTPAANGSAIPFVTESLPVGRAWRSSAFNISNAVPGVLNAFVYCL